MSNLPSLIVANDPIDLFNQVQKALDNRNDLLSAPFVHDGLICQHVAPTPPMYEYRLVTGADVYEYGAQVCVLSLQGFSLAWTPVHWNGKLVQWMCRWKDGDEKLSQLADVGSLLDSEGADPALRAEELKLVEGVREALGLGHEPVSSSWVIPFPLRLS